MSLDPAIFTLYQVGILIVVSSLVSELFRRIRLPGLIGAILVGLFIGGPGGLGLVTDLTVINVLGVLGSVLILFTIGLEFEAASFWRSSPAAFLLTTSGVVASVVAGFSVGKFLGWTDQAAFLLGVVIAPSGTSVVAMLLSMEGKAQTRSGSTLLTACVVDDVEGIVLLTMALATIAGSQFGLGEVSRAAIISVLFILGSIYVGGRVFPRFIGRLERVVSEEVLFATLLGFGLLLAVGATQVGLAAITGAFIMGAIIPYQKVGEKIAHRLLMMKEVFAAIFFTSIGLAIDPSAIPGLLPTAMLVLGLAFTARILGGVLGGALGGLRGKPLLAMIVGLAVRAEMSLIVAREGVVVGIVGPEFLALTATMVIGSIVIGLPVFSRLARNI